MVGSATLTMVASRMTMNCAITTTASTAPSLTREVGWAMEAGVDI